MDGVLNLIESGTSVDIRRTDGRIHSALISGVNLEARSVTVEWFERGETKGKEVELDLILQLNPELLKHPITPSGVTPHLSPPSAAPPPVMPNQLTREDSDSSEDEGGFLLDGTEESTGGGTMPARTNRQGRTVRPIPKFPPNT